MVGYTLGATLKGQLGDTGFIEFTFTDFRKFCVLVKRGLGQRGVDPLFRCKRERDAGILGFYMFENGQQFYGGDGIVTKGVENTINNIGRLGRDGMKETDREIIRIMLGE